ncbi:MAG: F0F1 ATP synthase subunit B [Pirellulales bacterium]
MREVVIVLMRKSMLGLFYGALGCLLVAAACWFVPTASAQDEPGAPDTVLAAPADEDVDDHAHDHAGEHGHHDLSHANASPAIKQAESWSAELSIYTLIVFLLTFALLAKFAFGPIAAGLAKREQAIANNIAAAEEASREAQRLTQQYEAKLAAAADEVRLMIEEARRDADVTRQDILAQARKDAEAERNRTIREINTAKDSALKELATLSAHQAVELAGRVVSMKLTPEEQSKLIQDALTGLPHGSPSNN